MSNQDLMIKNGTQQTLQPVSDKELKLVRVTESMLSHTLTETIAALQLILRDGNLPPDLFDYGYRSELNCRGTMAKINGVIELYAEDDAASSLRIAAYDLHQFFTALCNQLNRALGHKFKGKISFRTGEEESATVSLDARRVSMIVYHLVSNAVQHGRTENKNVELSATLSRTALELTVRDFGGGIPATKVDYLFAGFTRPPELSEIVESPMPPTLRGIGLPLCKKLAEDMHGSIQLKNYKTGAKFILQLPHYRERVQEVSVYLPDDTLMIGCMSDLFLLLMDEEWEESI